MSEIQIINPATEAVYSRHSTMDQAEISQIIENMEAVRCKFSSTPFSKRRDYLRNVAHILRDDQDSLAKLITNEMGKPITQAMGEVEKCAILCEYYAKEAETLLQPEPIKTEKHKSYRCFEALGIIFAIMPWNFPMWQVMRFAIPNLFAGNAGLLKHAPNSLGMSLAIEKIFKRAGFPAGLFRSLIIDVDLAPFVIQHPLVQGVTLTGSNRAGKVVASAAGAAMKKVVLELGGSDPYVILEDADLELAAEQCIISRLSNAGQICIAAKRIIIVDAIYDKFEKLILEKAKRYVMGDPLDPQTNLGPLARADLRDKLHDQVKHSIANGAECLLGGELPAGKGFYYPPTVLRNVTATSPAFTEELFGPVLCLIKARDEAEALTLANQTEFGLAAAVFTQDLKKGEHIAAHVLKAGCCAVNSLVASDPRLPFGGIKQSGFGRELSTEGLREFMNIKTVVVA